jgi:membrane-bound ClpP family serine protease
MLFYVTVGLVLVIVLAVLWLVLSSRGHKRHASSDKLIGATATVDQPLNPRGSVIVDGEVWLAVISSGEHVPKNTAVKVVGLKDQFLVVEQRDSGH